MFKEDINTNDLLQFTPATWVLFSSSVMYCAQHNLPFKVTSLISDRGNVKATSSTHEEGRAFDISVKGWTEQAIHRFVYIMNKNHSDIAAISASDGKPRAVIYHNNHLHIQCRREASINNYI